ncbi:MAG TPA: hypothetical protein VGN93_12510 [Shinella sp.]|jgi:hypothetical protein|uniref:hypothetical protein n=1 Tax=Shinella sp. TaxID=1870904 RepID=UPI0029A9952C|nr:hypothetical protein [Shinella sp.]MDX3974786.1 hypothetical protein [Shinella sp.]HEV7247796.1 hypothetical protein [Shinella sp.]
MRLAQACTVIDQISIIDRAEGFVEAGVTEMPMMDDVSMIEPPSFLVPGPVHIPICHVARP